MREIDRGHLRYPACVIDIDLDDTACHSGPIDVSGIQTAWCLLRRGGTAVAARFLDVAADDVILKSDLRQELRVAPPAPPASEPSDRASLTVVICTRNRPDGLLALLESLGKQSDPDFDVVVVDNSADGGVVGIAANFPGLRMRAVHEPMPGLSRARNRGLSEVTTDLTAWVDDDEVADADWVAWIRRGFDMGTQIGAVAGVMLPAELETEAQVDFERYGGFNKGRGMSPELLRAYTESAPEPLFPLPGFGAGGNMAFRTGLLRSLGGFDTRLGAGTLTRGGEDTRALSMVLEAGWTILHWPPAVTWHFHRRTPEALEEQFFGNCAGLTAFYMSALSARPADIVRIARFVAPGIQRIRANSQTGQTGAPPIGFPDRYLRAGRRGLFEGAWLYLREAARQRTWRRAR